MLIDGILRDGHTMLVTSRSKAGKSFLMLELAVAVAVGGQWLGRRCQRGRVLVVNPEIDPPSAGNRLREVAAAMCTDLDEVQMGVVFWHLRGHVQGMGETVDKLFELAHGLDFGLIVLDSIYELYDGVENDAGDAREFFHHVDRLSERLRCAVAMTHHHAKGSRADLDALDRGSGSGVYGRKPDAPIDLIQMFPPDGEEDLPGEGVTAWRVSDSGLREFPSMEPFDVFFKYPHHVPVTDGATDSWKPKSGQRTGGLKTAETNRRKSAGRAAKCELALAAEFVARGECDGISAKEAAAIVSGAIGEIVNAQTLKTYVEASEVLDMEQRSP